MADRILIVEDEEKLAGLLRDYLVQEGFEVAVLMRGDEVADPRIDLLAPAAAGEDAVVTGAGDVVVEMLVGGDAGAEVVRGAGLAGAGDVVELALDR